MQRRAAARWTLRCTECGARFELGPLVFGCPECRPRGAAGVLEAERDPLPDRPDLADRRRGPAERRYRDLLPLGQAPDWLTLGEGETPLVQSRVIGPRLGLRELYFKNEAANPTASFKDRYVALSLHVARHWGYRRVVVTSTGNLGVSVAAFAAAAGLVCLVVVPPEAPGPTLAQIRYYGAHLVRTARERRQALFEYVARKPDWFPVGLFLARPVQNPFGVEAYRAFAYEIVGELGRAPAALLFPCARGNGLYGAWKGFGDAVNWRWCDRAPAMIACQPEGANSLEVSLRTGAARCVELPRAESVAVSAAETVASDHALHAIRASGGGAVSASDPEIVAATRLLAREGLCVEPAAALPVACLSRLVDAAAIDRGGPTVCVLTATGLRWPDHLRMDSPPLPEIGDQVNDIERELATL